MTADEKLIAALCDGSTASTAEITGALGSDAGLLAIPKPSRDDSTWLVEFKADGDGPPMAHRMRAMLKAALRSYGLRCTVVRSPTAAEQAGTAIGWTDGKRRCEPKR
jgi:hypothetical protein